jgi:hypothetical protein
VFLIILITAIILLKTVFDPFYIIGHIEKSGFSEQSVEELNEVFISYGFASGIPSEIMSSLLTTRHVTNAVEGSILEAYNVGFGHSFEAYSDEVYITLYDYVISQGIDFTDELRTGLRDLADLCAAALKSHVNSPILNMLAQTQQYSFPLTLVIAVSTAMSLIAIAIILFVNHRVTRWIDGYIYALGSVSLICIALPVIAINLGLTSRLQISPQSLNNLISSWISGILSGYLIALIPLLLLMGVCVAVRVIRRTKRIRRF